MQKEGTMISFLAGLLPGDMVKMYIKGRKVWRCIVAKVVRSYPEKNFILVDYGKYKETINFYEVQLMVNEGKLKVEIMPAAG